MPLRKGKSRPAVSANIRTLINEGFPRDQAIAISMRKAGIPRKPKRRSKTMRHTAKRRSHRRRALLHRRRRSRR